MQTIAYIANSYPSPVEPYVREEVGELRRRGVDVISCSARRVNHEDGSGSLNAQVLSLLPITSKLALRGTWQCMKKFGSVADLVAFAILRGEATLGRRFRALTHTWLGACYALLLQERNIKHIHAHHGYFSSWVAMSAARFLDVGFSFTLHGSDLLVSPSWLDLKLANCKFCITVSDFNRNHVIANYPSVLASKILVQHIGVETSEDEPAIQPPRFRFTLLAVGRLHAVKDHAFLVRACKELQRKKIDFSCWIAGEGPERVRLAKLIGDLGLENSVYLLGHLSVAQLDVCYQNADLIVLTSQSEGIPLVLMEAMALRKLVLAPRITGIPELVVDGVNGLLYSPGSVDGFVDRIERARALVDTTTIRSAAREQVLKHFDRDKTLKEFCETFLGQLDFSESRDTRKANAHAGPLLQQI
jgi:glycosyltransferase involved in cell wall biosynthesis